MLDWLVDKILALVGALPALFVSEDSPNFTLVRTMFALLLLILVICLIAMRPFRSYVIDCMNRASEFISRKR
jgi:hypothetical protein